MASGVNKENAERLLDLVCASLQLLKRDCFSPEIYVHALV